MPRRKIFPQKARAELLAIKLETARYEIRALRRAERENEAALALCKSTPDWVDMKEQFIQLELEIEMDEMEACIDERRPKIPILDKAKMAKLRVASSLMTPNLSSRSAADDPLPDDPAPWDIAYQNIKRPDPPNGEAWKHPGTLPGRHPADDWRNWE